MAWECQGIKKLHERAVIFCDKDVIGVNNLAAQYKKIIEDSSSDDYEEALESLNREIILDALEQKQRGEEKSC